MLVYIHEDTCPWRKYLLAKVLIFIYLFIYSIHNLMSTWTCQCCHEIVNKNFSHMYHTFQIFVVLPSCTPARIPPLIRYVIYILTKHVMWHLSCDSPHIRFDGFHIREASLRFVGENELQSTLDSSNTAISKYPLI